MVVAPAFRKFSHETNFGIGCSGPTSVSTNNSVSNFDRILKTTASITANFRCFQKLRSRNSKPARKFCFLFVRAFVMFFRTTLQILSTCHPTHGVVQRRIRRHIRTMVASCKLQVVVVAACVAWNDDVVPSHGRRAVFPCLWLQNFSVTRSSQKRESSILTNESVVCMLLCCRRISDTDPRHTVYAARHPATVFF
jgi:hypothetical protein